MFSVIYFSFLVLCSPLFVENAISNETQKTTNNVSTTPSTITKNSKDTASKDPFIRWIEKIKSEVSKKFKNFVITEEMIDLAFKLDEAELNDECRNSFSVIHASLKNYETWAVKMMDSSGKFPGGMFYGTLSSLGNYDECLDVIGKSSKKVEFIGQYCAINFQMFRPKSYDVAYLAKELKRAHYFSKITSKYSVAEWAIAIRLGKFRVGLCFPSSCNFTDISKVVKILSDHYHTNSTLEWCETNERYHNLDVTQWFTLWILVAIILVSVSASMFAWIGSLVQKKRKTYSLRKSEENLFDLFSLTKNMSAILSTKTGDERIAFMAGMRFLSMTWVIAAHTYVIQHIFIVGNAIKLRDIPKQFIFQVFMNGTLATDSFLFYSGFVVAYTFFKKQEQFKLVSALIFYYLNRVLRLTAILGFVIALCIVLPPFGSGPLWSEILGMISNNCRKNWWKTLMLYSNFEKLPEICLPHSWFTSMESQLFFFAPFATIAFLRAPKIGLFVCLFAIVCSVVNISYETITNNYPPVPIFQIKNAYYFEELQKYIENVLLNPITHLSPYCIAIGSAYFISKPKTVEISKESLCFGWIASFIVKVVVLWTVYLWNSGREGFVEFNVSYAATHRSIWAVTLAWDTIACATTNCGFIRNILSWSFFIPLSRVTLSAYLLHPLLMAVFIGSIRTPYYFSHFLMFNRFFSFLTITYLAAFFLTAIVDFPLKNLLQFIINPSSKYGIDSSKPYESECKFDTNANDEKWIRNHTSFNESQENDNSVENQFAESSRNRQTNCDTSQNIEMIKK